MSTAPQKALFLPEKHGEWTLGEREVPSPGPKEVLVKIMSTALNPLDWKFQTIGIFVQTYPFIAGTDAAGIVEEVGPEVTTLAKGDKILFQGWFDADHSTFQQHALVPAELSAKIPENVSFDQAATVPVCFATVFTALWNQHPRAKSVGLPAPWEESGQTKVAGKPIFILGGSSSVGQFAIQAARLYKFSPIITTASPRNEGLLKTLGATHVLDRALPASTLLGSLQTITGGSPLELVYDAVASPDTQAVAYEALAPGGTLLITQSDAIKKESDGKKVVQVFGSIYPPENRQVGTEAFRRLTEWLETGVIVPNPVEVLPNGLVGIPEGLERLKANKVSGTKLVARPQETP